MNDIRTQCVKVAHLRKIYGKDITLKLWLDDPKNLYVGRCGRIFINGVVFHYKQSKWANPYKVGTGKDKYTLENSLKLYREYILKSELKDQLNELDGKNLGCFCDQNNECHAKVLVELYHKYK